MTLRAQRLKSSSGFTLIELMLVMAIIGVLASIAIPSVQGQSRRVRRIERTIMMKVFERAAIKHLDGLLGDTRKNVATRFDAAMNPPLPLWSPTRPKFDPNAEGWKSLEVVPD